VNGTAEPAEPQNLTYIPKAAAIAREAGARLREFYAHGVETEYKGDVDIVTVADRTVEKLIRARLGEAFPDHGVYGEEGTRERMEPRISLTDFRSSACQWAWNIGQQA
jgi:fructose-1,6-bisphosphatase/inositol monophosphatase family enzyme